MIVLVNGMVRSGSTWSYNVVLELLRRAHPDEIVYGGFSETPVEFLTRAPKSARHVAIKCHRLDRAARTLAQSGAARVVFTMRDPWDATASGMRAFGVSFAEALGNVALGLEAMRFHRETGTAVIVPYVEMSRRPEAAILRIARYLLGRGVPAGLVAEVAAETSFERMREKAAAIVGKRQDRATLLYRNHVSDGASGYGRACLTPRQVEAVARRVAKYELTL